MDPEDRDRTFVKRFEDIALEWMWEVDADGHYTYASAVVEKLLGYTPEEILDKHFYDLFHPDEADTLRRAAFEVFAHKESFRELVNRNVHKDGRTVWLSTSGVPILDEAGNLRGYRGADTDITEQRQAAEALRRSEAELRQAFEALSRSEAELRQAFETSTDAIFWADPASGVITRCNRAAELLLERDREEIIGLHQTDFHPPDEAERVARMFRGHLERGGPLEEEAVVVTAAGEIRHVAITASVLTVEGRSLIQGVFRDITSRKRAEEERRRIEEKMRQSQKLESLGVLAGGIAHDFNNLLMGILGNAGLAIRVIPPESPARAYLDTIEKTSQRAAELTNQLLAYSGKGRFVVQPLDLNNLVAEMSHLLETVVTKKASIRSDFGSRLPLFMGDASQIRQVVMNLITNASDAIGDRSGTISVSTGVQDIDASYLAGAHASDDTRAGLYAYVEVSDTGGGMGHETIDRMFDPFYSTKSTGRGLGLAAVLGIVRGHRGAIM